MSALPPSEEEIDDSGCELLGKFGLLLQFGLAVVAFSSLLFKRYREKPKRPTKIWLLFLLFSKLNSKCKIIKKRVYDVSKQALSQGMLHSLNVLFSFTLADPCVQYFMNIMLDTTIGVLIMGLFVWILKRVIKRYRLKRLAFGDYGNPPLFSNFMLQLLLFLSLALIMKLIVRGIIMIPFLEEMSSFLLSPLKGHPNTELVVVMVITPLCMNIFQFWVVDQLIKRKSGENKPTSASNYNYSESDFNNMEEDDSRIFNANVYGIDENL